MRVLTFLYSFAPGGVERIAARLHAAWVGRGIDSRIVLADVRIGSALALTAVTQVAAEPRSATLARFVALLRGLPAIIAADRVDVLFCAGNTYTAPAVALRLVLGKACPPILAKISNDLLRPDMPWLVRIFYRRWLRIQGRYIDHFVGMAPAMRGEIARLIGVAPDRISIIEDPALSTADLARLASVRDGTLRDRPGRHYLAIGRLAPQKNFALLLDAFARIAQPDDRLRILGEGPERAALEAQAARLGIADKVVLPGHTDPLDIWLGAADAFVLSSDFEGVPAVVIEALAAGLPIIATDCCVSMADLLGQGALGQLVPVGDAAALAAAMAAIAATEPEPIRHARRSAAQRFTIEHATDKYVVLLERLAA
ncbi:glycosyltransferase, partial [Sphingomonas sp.]|uniref:glycosyltransferase n=1 Tax=Sphingomonas sp. TaxID=28214 RepID=UPI00334022B9